MASDWREREQKYLKQKVFYTGRDARNVGKVECVICRGTSGDGSRLQRIGSSKLRFPILICVVGGERLFVFVQWKRGRWRV